MICIAEAKLGKEPIRSVVLARKIFIPPYKDYVTMIQEYN